MTTTLTERYIGATIAALPLESQDDVRAELEASIADAVEARREQGETPEAAERAVLTELGDPGVLAAGFSDRPLHLIGPRLYLAWRRLLKLLLAIVPAAVLVAVALGHTISGGSSSEIIGDSIVAALGSIVHVAFWVTLVFVILERTGSDTTIGIWDVDQLPEPKSTGTGRADMIATLVFAAIMVGLILWDRFRGFVWIDGSGVPILHPDLWPWAILVLFALILLEAALAVLIHARGRWTTGHAVANTALAVLAASWALTLLGNDLLISPDFLDRALQAGGAVPGSLRILGILLVVGIVGVAVWDIIDGWLKTRRDARR